MGVGLPASNLLAIRYEVEDPPHEHVKLLVTPWGRLVTPSSFVGFVCRVIYVIGNIFADVDSWEIETFRETVKKTYQFFLDSHHNLKDNIDRYNDLLYRARHGVVASNQQIFETKASFEEWDNSLGVVLGNIDGDLLTRIFNAIAVALPHMRDEISSTTVDDIFRVKDQLHRCHVVMDMEERLKASLPLVPLAKLSSGKDLSEVEEQVVRKFLNNVKDADIPVGEFHFLLRFLVSILF